MKVRTICHAGRETKRMANEILWNWKSSQIFNHFEKKSGECPETAVKLNFSIFIQVSNAIWHFKPFINSWHVVRTDQSTHTRSITEGFYIFQLFIILKKKNSHLSFLHCYHHFFMVLATYIAVRWVPGGHGLLLGLVNVYVHAFMYFYYFLTAFKLELKQSIWKKHITQFQMVIPICDWVAERSQLTMRFTVSVFTPCCGIFLRALHW